MKENIKKNAHKYGKYIFLFCFFLCWNLIISSQTLDEVWNYGFSYAIAKGEIPYLDYNMVITPLFPFLMAIPLALFGNNIFIFQLFWIFILLGMFYFIFKFIDNKAYILFFILLFPLDLLFPSYNMFLLFLFILLIYLENNDGNDYLIGTILAMTILTKQTVGLVLVLPCLYYLKNPNKIFKRFIGCIIPLIIFLLYLLVSKSLNQFVDLCFLGLFDFADGNGNLLNWVSISSLILVIIVCLFIKRDKKNIDYYYLLAFYSIVLPIFDLYHFNVFIVAFLLILFKNRNIDLKINIKLFFIGVSIGVAVISYNFKFDNYKPEFVDFDAMKYRAVNKKQLNYISDLYKFFQKYSDKKIIFLSADGYYFKIATNQKIEYFDLINNGNWGYNGSEKLLKKIKQNKKDVVYFVDYSELEEHCQTDHKAMNYMIKNGKLIDSLYDYYVYVLE